jgi:hypothetical protein
MLVPLNESMLGRHYDWESETARVKYKFQSISADNLVSVVMIFTASRVMLTFRTRLAN